METVTLRPLQHRSTECIGIHCTQNATLNYYFQKKAGAKWSRSNRCWYMPCAEKNYELLSAVLNGKAVLEVEELKKYLLERKKKNEGVLASGEVKTLLKQTTAKHAPVAAKKPEQKKRLQKISSENNNALQQFRQQLVLKSYSGSTMRTYTNEFMQFLQTIGQVPATEFTTARIKDYLQYCREKLKLSENTLHSRINAFYPVGLKKMKN